MVVSETPRDMAWYWIHETPLNREPEIHCREAYHRDFTAECARARKTAWGNGAVASQMIINKALGLTTARTRQGSHVVGTLTYLAEEAVYKEFEAISERRGEIATEIELIRSMPEEKGTQIANVKTHGDARNGWCRRASRCCRTPHASGRTCSCS